MKSSSVASKVKVKSENQPKVKKEKVEGLMSDEDSEEMADHKKLFGLDEDSGQEQVHKKQTSVEKKQTSAQSSGESLQVQNALEKARFTIEILVTINEELTRVKDEQEHRLARDAGGSHQISRERFRASYLP